MPLGLQSIEAKNMPDLFQCFDARCHRWMRIQTEPECEPRVVHLLILTARADDAQMSDGGAERICRTGVEIEFLQCFDDPCRVSCELRCCHIRLVNALVGDKQLQRSNTKACKDRQSEPEWKQDQFSNR